MPKGIFICARRSDVSVAAETASRGLEPIRPTGRIGLVTTDDFKLSCECAEVAKLVDALRLGRSGVTHGGSSPLLSTLWKPSVFQRAQILYKGALPSSTGDQLFSRTLSMYHVRIAGMV